jgi:hypothetical protein
MAPPCSQHCQVKVHYIPSLEEALGRKLVLRVGRVHLVGGMEAVSGAQGARNQGVRGLAPGRGARLIRARGEASQGFLQHCSRAATQRSHRIARRPPGRSVEPRSAPPGAPLRPSPPCRPVTSPKHRRCGAP